MEEYYKHPQDTEAVLVKGILSTGDLERFDEEGKLHVTGRKKEILVLDDGTKIYLPEYEAVLTRALETTELAVILKNSRVWLAYYGEKDKQDLWKLLSPVMENYLRNQQIFDIIIVDTP